MVAHAHAADLDAVGKSGLFHVGHWCRRLATGREAGEEAEQFSRVWRAVLHSCVHGGDIPRAILRESDRLTAEHSHQLVTKAIAAPAADVGPARAHVGRVTPTGRHAGAREPLRAGGVKHGPQRE